MKRAILRTGIEALYWSGAHALARPLARGVGAILAFHHVRPSRRDAFQPNCHLETTPKRLATLVKRLKRWKVECVTLDEMQRRLSEGDFSAPFVCFTFDDSYRDTREWAYPILAEAGVPFAVYVPTSFPDRFGKLWWRALELAVARNNSVSLEIDGGKQRYDTFTLAQKQEIYAGLYGWLRSLPTEAELVTTVEDIAARHGVDIRAICAEDCMDRPELAALAADPLVTVGAHTVNHIRLAKASETTLRTELTMGASVLEAALGQRPRHLAYPYGGDDAVGAREAAIAEELGYVTAVTSRASVLRKADAGRQMLLPRLAVGGSVRTRHVKAVLSGAACNLWGGLLPQDLA